MMRRFLVAVLLACVSHPARAQGAVGGYVFDRITGRAMPCIDVALVRGDSGVVARTRTVAGGAFMMAAPAAGEYRVRFSAFGVRPAFTPPDTLSPRSERDVVYRVAFTTARDSTSTARWTDADADAPPWPIDPSAGPKYPESMRRSALEGNVVARYLVDSTGVVDDASIERLLDSDQRLFAAVKAFLQSARFRPGRRDSVPVCDLVTQEFRFRLGR